MFPLDFPKVLPQPRVLVKHPQSDKATRAGGPRQPPHPWGPPVLGAFNSCPLHAQGPQEMTRDLIASMHTPHVSVSLSWEDSPGICILQKIWGAPQEKKKNTRNSTTILNSHLVFLISPRRHLLGVEQFGANMALTPSNPYTSLS